MLDLFVLILFCFVLANVIDIQSTRYDSVLIARKRNFRIQFKYLILLIALILFSGLRTSYNDTSAYMYGYTLIKFDYIDWHVLLEPYGGFEVLQQLLKKYISTDPQCLILASSIITNTIFLWFFSKYSKNFTLTILSYLIIGPYMFSMAGIKQILSMSVSLFAIDGLLRRKNIRFIFGF